MRTSRADTWADTGEMIVKLGKFRSDIRGFLVPLLSFYCDGMTIFNEEDIKEAIRKEADSIVIEDETIGRAFLVAGRVQNGLLPAIVLERIKKDGTCRVSVGEGIVIPVTRGLAETALRLLEAFDDRDIEIDVEEVAGRKFNIYYGS